MALSYNKLWKLLIDKGLKKGELNKITGISESTMAKLAKGENVNTDILERICNALNCQIGDIVEIIDFGGYKDGK
ncbi:MAG: helix-turn-helix domain-containing protein [Bacilli bacterium]